MKTTDNIVEGDIRNIGNIQETLCKEMWANGSSAPEIAQALNQPIEHVYKLLKKTQKTIIEDEIGHHEKTNNI